MSVDTGRDALAQRYYIQALDLAMRAGDRLYAAFVLATMSRMTVRIGENTPVEQDTARHGRQAVALARAGLTITQGAATPALAAELHALEAQGLALLGEANAARRAALTAQRVYESVRPGEELPWRDFYTEHALIADVGSCLSNIGETTQAITLNTTALQGLEPWRVRGQSLVQTHIAIIHLSSRDLEQAAAYGRDALRSATDVSDHDHAVAGHPAPAHPAPARQLPAPARARRATHHLLHPQHPTKLTPGSWTRSASGTGTSGPG